MREPIQVLEYTADGTDQVDHPGPVIMETPVSTSTPERLARIANDLAVNGRTRLLLAESPLYWQRKLARALIAGAVMGSVATILSFIIFK